MIPGNDAARPQFHEQLTDAELFPMLAQAPEDDNITLVLFDMHQDQFTLAPGI
ncbi:MAG: hypothetical protein GDA36_02380 [Rhodobacteraceae bacterium]|nr:hypothetical protein [Paracoccaceae bacterium]